MSLAEQLRFWLWRPLFLFCFRIWLAYLSGLIPNTAHGPAPRGQLRALGSRKGRIGKQICVRLDRGSIPQNMGSRLLALQGEASNLTKAGPWAWCLEGSIRGE